MAQLSRRSLLKGGALAAGASMIGMTQILAAAPALQFASDLDILNYALTLEHLEYAFYRDGIARLGVGALNAVGNVGGQSVGSLLTAIRDHEGAHVQTLISVIQSLGGTPVSEAQYNFPYTDARSFIAVAQALENTGVSAYDGAIRFIQSPDLTEAAATIATVEARHAAYLNLLNGVSPFPAAFDDPKSQAEILAIAGPFIVSAPPAPQNPIGAATISSPTANQVVAAGSTTTIRGSVALGPSDSFYKVEITGGQFGSGWVTVGMTRNTSVNNGTLETLGPVAPGTYQVRVVVVGNNSNFTQQSAPVSFQVQQVVG